MKLKNGFIGMLIILLCVPLMSSGAARAASAVITLELDGRTLESDVPPFITSRNVTMVPLRVISKGLGAQVEWNQSSKTVTIIKGGNELKLTNGKKTAVVNGTSVSLDNPVLSRQGRIMVPIRFVAENLGLQVVWNKAAKLISLYTGAEPPQASDPEEPQLPSVPVVPKPTVPTVPDIPGAGSKAMKGVWISSVYNLDWPSASSIGKIDQQKEEFSHLLDSLKAIGFNAVFVQVRPSGDSLYPSSLVPWSKVLTGTQGKDPGYDPLQFMIDAAHDRGMQFHAWFNPFRATTDASDKSLAALAANHVAKAHPEWVVKADGKLYINPGIPEARQSIIDTVLEVVKGYAIDGVHLDDYFYPSGVTFDDDNAFKAYNAGGIASKADWRRDNINNFVRELGEQIHALKPEVSYGISPFGVWRNIKLDSTGSDTTAGVSAYDDMYADVRTWIKQGWIDYVAPQVYWSLSYNTARYDKLVEWWVNEVRNTGVKLYIGQAAYKVGAANQSAEWQSGEQIISQLKFNENYVEVEGSIMFRAYDIVVRNPSNLSGLLTFYFKT
ncbi:uncharacterized lipoprotein YddW (UPF0748 family) [Paenibacillus forsythiae]|uniref:Uncharacterized lipoprotein YddW (UPF0748 family) n=1 Tax=Paenibacillus forsythiae TaxID=365616 RepID=A0ABU3H9E4_9BACL|nr:family 10 glycosylhydrolase [Paenibacillus forsythiae]MDT3427453.1 uncharacterized lipoprotein YddW (UPF0748 family) [Paenibacillus forsythiae]